MAMPSAHETTGDRPHLSATVPPPRAEAPPTTWLATERRDPASGVLHRRLALPDVTDESPTREANRAVLQVLDDLLALNADWPAPRVVDGRVDTTGNPVSQWLYRSAALREWREVLVPSAKALYPVQRVDEALPSGSTQDETTRLVLLDSLDATGIRTRAKVMGEVVRRAVRRTGADLDWVSLACGAAVPVLEARRTVVADGAGAPVLRLVDLDADALDFARRLSHHQGLREGRDFTLLHRDLVRTVVSSTALVEELGAASAAVVDALGIFEYFRDAAAVRLLRHAFQLLVPGGVLVVANMLADRPQLAFNQRGAGWPRLHVRSVDDLVDLVRRAGLPLDRTTVSIPQDGVYAVVDVVR